MTISLFENANFLELIKEFTDYELNIKFEKELYIIQFRINNIVYISSHSDIVECMRNLIIVFLNKKAEETSISVDGLVNEWKTLEELIQEVREMKE